MIEKNYPNPFENSTTLKLFIHKDDAGHDNSLEVYNCLGQLVYRIDLSKYSEGWHELEVVIAGNANHAAGIYLARLKIDSEFVSTIKLNYMVR